jgi:2-(1,2-epoxy-1,2-dihydrophenyl)acetyl-CoA isomerase
MVELVHDGGRAAYLFRKPLISAVCGVAFGAGLSLALSADIVVAAEDARLCEVFARVGGCPDTGSSWLLRQRAGAGVARMLVLTGREIDGRTARDLRVVEECVPANQVEARALEIAREIATHPMFGVQTAKRVMRAAAECSYLEALDIERDAQSVLLCAHDFPEAMKAFSEKRTPEFKDR